MAGPPVLAVDIGGTKTAVATGPARGGPVDRVARFATPPDAAAALRTVLDEGRRLTGGEQVTAVGVSFGGHVDGDDVHSLHVPGWDDAGLVPALREAFGAPVRLVNDAEAGVIAEFDARAASGVRHLVYVTVSTGIGAALVADGRLLRGTHGMAGEIGHYPLADEGRCSCGRVGHLEALASGTAIARRATDELAGGAPSRLAGGPVEASDVDAAARAGDELARRVLADAGALVGRALAIAALTVDPDVICLGGGVSQAGGAFWDPLLRVVGEQTLRPVRVEPAVHGPDSALVGALAVARDPRAWLGGAP